MIRQASQNDEATKRRSQKTFKQRLLAEFRADEKFKPFLAG
jgi:hypothetical protein